MAFIGISSLVSAVSRVFTRNYDINDLSRLVEFLRANMTPAGTVNYIDSVAPLPDGWLYAEGQTVNVSDYPDLFDAVGYFYGGAGPVFVVPNHQNRIAIGSGGLVAFRDTVGGATISPATVQVSPGSGASVYALGVGQTVNILPPVVGLRAIIKA